MSRTLMQSELQITNYVSVALASHRASLRITNYAIKSRDGDLSRLSNRQNEFDRPLIVG
jgi:hypothetical protein